MMSDKLIPKHGGYRKLKSFQLAQLIFDITVRFCDRYIDKRSRTHDQMVQAARSGPQNIAEGSQASGTSKKTELKLTSVARSSLEELKLDYQDFLRQRNFPQWEPDSPALKRFKATRCGTMEEFRAWVVDEEKRQKTAQTNTDGHGPARTYTDAQPRAAVPQKTKSSSVGVGERRCESVPVSAIVANGALSLLNICNKLLDKQLAAQEESFKEEGGFTERLYRVRQDERKKQMKRNFSRTIV
jgi:four helix bundle suffix protein